MQVKKEKKKKNAGPAVIKVPGMPTVVKSEAVKTKVATHVVKDNKKTKKQLITTVQTVKKTTKVQVAAQAPQWHSMQSGDAQDDDEGVDPLEQALGSMKEMAKKQATKPPRKKQKSATGKAVAAQKTENKRLLNLLSLRLWRTKRMLNLLSRRQLSRASHQTNYRKLK